MNNNEPESNIFGQKFPEKELFHYTSLEGLKGIVNGKTLWATNIEFLNDTAEYRHGESVLNKTFARRKQSAKDSKRAFFDQLENSQDFFHADDVFVISLSEKGDLLSQWRGYTPSNCGFSIGFDPDCLAMLSKSLDSMELIGCVYDESGQKELANELLDFCLRRWVNENETKGETDSTSFRISSTISYRIYKMFVSASMKHQSFSEEKEWRLLGVCKDSKRFRFRAGKSSITPYIELKWGPETKETSAQPIRSITIGPCPDSELARKSVTRFLKSCDLENIHVHNSEIPFRSW